MKSRIQIAVILLVLMSINTACQKQSKYDGEIEVEYTPRHVNLIRPIVEPERIYQMSIENRSWECLPTVMKDMRNLRELDLSNMKIQDWKASKEIINSFSKLERLEVSSLNIDILPFSSHKLTELKELDLIATEGYSLDNEISKINQLDSLEFLCIGGLKTDHLPKELANHNNLRRFHFGYHGKNFDYKEGINIVSNLPKLEYLQFDIVEFEKLPSNLNKLHNLKKLGFYIVHSI